MINKHHQKEAQHKGTFYHWISRYAVIKSSRQPLGRQSVVLLLCFLIYLPVTLHADIAFQGTCGSYSYKLEIPTNRYFGGQCIGNRLYVYNDANRDEIKGIYTDPPTSTYIDIYDLQNFRVDNSFDATQNDGYVRYVGEFASLTYVLAGSFIGFTILFFSTFLFIEVAKK
ncbi:MAG: hypothetical protein K0U47_12640 [Epsilonproteobacteria bacterium]|nr:hypothetical protein [Campylobacterota bacterium]